MRTVEEHRAAFSSAGADPYKLVEAFGEAMTDLIEAREDVEKYRRMASRGLNQLRETAAEVVKSPVHQVGGPLEKSVALIVASETTHRTCARRWKRLAKRMWPWWRLQDAAWYGLKVYADMAKRRLRRLERVNE